MQCDDCDVHDHAGHADHVTPGAVPLVHISYADLGTTGITRPLLERWYYMKHHTDSCALFNAMLQSSRVISSPGSLRFSRIFSKGSGKLPEFPLA